MSSSTRHELPGRFLSLHAILIQAVLCLFAASKASAEPNCVSALNQEEISRWFTPPQSEAVRQATGGASSDERVKFAARRCGTLFDIKTVFGRTPLAMFTILCHLCSAPRVEQTCIWRSHACKGPNCEREARPICIPFRGALRKCQGGSRDTGAVCGTRLVAEFQGFRSYVWGKSSYGWNSQHYHRTNRMRCVVMAKSGQQVRLTALVDRRVARKLAILRDEFVAGLRSIDGDAHLQSWDEDILIGYDGQISFCVGTRDGTAGEVFVLPSGVFLPRR